MKLKKIAQFTVCSLVLASCIFALTACNDAQPKEEQKAVVENTHAPVSSVGTPSAAPVIKPEGSVHTGEVLSFVIIGAFKSKEDAQAFCTSTNESVAQSGLHSYYSVIETSTLVNCDIKDPFIVAEAYPSDEAIQGYNALDFGVERAQKGFTARTFNGLFTGKQAIVVYGKDVVS